MVMSALAGHARTSKALALGTLVCPAPVREQDNR